MSSNVVTIPIRERPEAPEGVVPILRAQSSLKLTPLQKAHVALLAAVSRLPREHALAFDLPADPEPDEVRSLGAMLDALAEAVDGFTQKVGLSLRGISPEGVDLTVFASPLAGAFDGYASHEIDRAAHAVSAEADCF